MQKGIFFLKIVIYLFIYLKLHKSTSHRQTSHAMPGVQMIECSLYTFNVVFVYVNTTPISVLGDQTSFQDQQLTLPHCQLQIGLLNMNTK